jgi:acetyl-CoA carboxylase biotin carboxyl carrier protein
MVMSFSHEDVQRLLQLLDGSQFDELQLETEGIKLSLRRNGAGSSFAPLTSSATPVALQRPVIATEPASPAQPAAKPSSDPTLLEIRAPMLGTFYGAPKPGAEPFATVGGRVEANTAVAIIEVMKLMNSISAGVAGVVVEVLARDGDLVEFDQVLMRVRPE